MDVAVAGSERSGTQGQPETRSLWEVPSQLNQVVGQFDESVVRSVIERLTAIERECSKRQTPILEKAASLETDIKEMRSRASGHLAAEGVSIDDPGAGDSALPSLDSNAPPRSPEKCLEIAAGLISAASSHLETLRSRKTDKQPLWPFAEGFGCGALIAYGVVAGICLAMLVNLTHSDMGVGPGFALMVILMGFFHMIVVVVNARSNLAGIRQAYSDVRNPLLRATPLVEEARTRVQAEITALRDKGRSELRHWLAPMIETAIPVLGGLAAASRYAGADWNDPIWQEWGPSGSSLFGCRFGMVQPKTRSISQAFPDLPAIPPIPALVPFSDGRGLLVKVEDPSDHGEVAAAAQSALLRILATVPPGKARMTFIDPVGMGSQVACFMSLGDHEEMLINSRVWTEPQHIEQRLADLCEHMETVIQKFLRKDFETIHQYNEAAGEVAEPFRFLVVFDFPANFSPDAFRRLVSIARNGARCGVYVMVVHNHNYGMPYDCDLQVLARLCHVVRRVKEDGKSTDRGAFACESLFGGWQIVLDGAPPPALLDQVIGQVGSRAKEAMRVEVPFEKMLSLADLPPEKWWCGTSADGVSVPLGPTGARRIQRLALGQGLCHHALIIGRPGSGKSNLMHVIITGLALAYSPDELRLFLIDFKKGVEFKPYAQYRLPHAFVIAIDSEREFGLSVIEGLEREMKERGDRFRAAGAENISEFRRRTGEVLPRLVLVIDEFQEMFSEDDELGRRAALILDRLVRQGRAFGIHLVLGSQTLAGAAVLSRSTLDQMSVRIALQCSEADSRLILADDNPAARLLSRPGEAIYNASSGLVEGNNLFQVALFDEANRASWLWQMYQAGQQNGYADYAPIVFEGDELARVETCGAFTEMVSAAGWPERRASVDVLLGEPIAIRPPVVARLRRLTGSNLLVVSRDEAEGTGMCVSAALSILTQRAPSEASICIADFTNADAEWAEHAEHFERHFPGGVRVIGRQRDVPELLGAVAEETKRRQDAGGHFDEYLYLMLQGMHRIRALREDEEDDDGFNGVALLKSILRDGPEVGVHVIAWIDTCANLYRGIGRQAVRDFGLRVASAMSVDDSMGLLDDGAAARLSKPHRAIFYDEERPGSLVTFRPYAMPSQEWLEKVGAVLKQRAGAG